MKAASASPFKLIETIELGPAWAGNSVNCVPFRLDGICTHADARYLAYFDANGDICVVRQDLRDGRLTRATLPNDRKPYDAHQCISLGIDRRGRVHLAFGAHGSTLLTTHSHTPYPGDGFTPLVEGRDGATYPMFIRFSEGELAMLHRRGRHDAGEVRVEHLDADADRWIPQDDCLISGIGTPWSAGPYLNTPVRSADDAVHLFLVWRLPAAASSAGAVANTGIDYLVATDRLRRLATRSGVALSLPASPLTAERAIPVPVGASLMNQATAGLLPGDRPAVLTYWEAGDGVPQYQLGWHTGKAWQVQTLSQFRTPFRLDGGGTLPLPHSRPELLVHPDGRLVVLYRSSEYGNRLLAEIWQPRRYERARMRRQILVDEDLGFYEPIVDRAAWRARGELVLYVQRCEQGMGRDAIRSTTPQHHH
jgi:hypothetical protein